MNGGGSPRHLRTLNLFIVAVHDTYHTCPVLLLLQTAPL